MVNVNHSREPGHHHPLGCLGTIFRLLTMAEHVEEDDITYAGESLDGDDDNSSLQRRGVMALFCPTFVVVMLIEFLVVAPYAFIAKLVKGFREARESNDGRCFNICKPNDEDDVAATKEFKELVRKGEMGLDAWTLMQGVKDMNRWIDPVNRSNSLDHLRKLLYRAPPSQDSLTSFLQDQTDPTKQRYKISSLSIVVLTKVATIFIPSTMSQCLFNSFDEVSEVIHYIDRKLNSSSLKSNKKSMVSETLWAGEKHYTLFTKPKFDASKSELQLDQAVENIEELKRILSWGRHDLKDEISMIIDFIEHSSYTSIEELYSIVQKLFVDMLNELLYQIPCVVFKDIIESRPEDLEERVKFALKIVHGIEKLDSRLQWSFPAGTTITNLSADDNRTMPESNSNVVPDASAEEIINAENQRNMPLEVNCTTSNAPQSGEENASLIVSETSKDEIIQIE